jgi:hypothetical protein
MEEQCLEQRFLFQKRDNKIKNHKPDKLCRVRSSVRVISVARKLSMTEGSAARRKLFVSARCLQKLNSHMFSEAAGFRDDNNNLYDIGRYISNDQARYKLPDSKGW